MAESDGERTRKWLSIEIVIAVCFPMLAGAFAYGQLHGKVEDNADNVKIVAVETKVTAESVQDIKTDVAVIKTKVDTISEAVKTAAQKSEENARTLQEILRRLPQ